MSKSEQRAGTQTRENSNRDAGPRSSRGGNDQGIVRDERGQEQPRDKARAQHVSRVDRGGDPPGKKG
jgi:hypothetical protein